MDPTRSDLSGARAFNYCRFIMTLRSAVVFDLARSRVSDRIIFPTRGVLYERAY